MMDGKDKLKYMSILILILGFEFLYITYSMSMKMAFLIMLATVTITASTVYLKNSYRVLIAPLWNKIIAWGGLLYSAFFLFGVLYLNQPFTNNNPIHGLELATAGTIKRSLVGYGYLGKLDYKRIYISEALNKFEKTSAIGESKKQLGRDKLLEKVYDQSSDKVLVFFKNSCPNCVAGMPTLLEDYEKLSNQGKSKILFVNLETEDGQILAEEFEIERASTMIFVNNLGDSSKDRKILPFSESGKPKRDNIREMFGLIEK